MTLVRRGMRSGETGLERTRSTTTRPTLAGTGACEQAPVPAKVGRVVVERVLSRPVSPDLIPLLTNVMHWSYGIGWGGVYGVLANSVPRASKLGTGPYFGAGVWAMSYVELVP